MSNRIPSSKFFFQFFAIGGAVVTAAVSAYFFRYQSSIKIEREIVVANVGLMKALIPMDDGSFVIAGQGETSAFAMHINAEGERLWTFEESHDPTARRDDVFHSGVELTGGRVMLCGEKTESKNYTFGVVSILDSSGKLVDQRKIGAYPLTTEIPRCLKWGKDRAIVGWSSQFKNGEPVSTGWVIKTDSSGNVLWTKSFPGTQVNQVVRSGPDGLAFASNLGLVAFVDETGEITAMQSWPRRFILLRPVDSDITELGLIADSQTESSASLMHLNKKFEAVYSEKNISLDSITDGCGFLLKNGSAVLFAQTDDSSNTREAVTLIDRWGFIAASYQFEEDSLGPEDAASISPGRFVVMRMRTRGEARDLILTWIRIR